LPRATSGSAPSGWPTRPRLRRQPSSRGSRRWSSTARTTSWTCCGTCWRCSVSAATSW